MPTLRPITEDEYHEYSRTSYSTFGETPRDVQFERNRTITELDRSVAAFDARGKIVGTALALSDRLGVPGGELNCAGITAVGVRTDHRRQGLLTQMMQVLLDQAADRREPLAALYASQAPIYGRYGFGPAAPAVQLSVKSRPDALVREPDAKAEIVEPDEAMAAMPDILKAAGRMRAGLVRRDAARWQWYFGHDDEEDRDGASLRYHALVEGRGYVMYRLRPTHGDSRNGKVLVSELVATDPDAYAALWKLVLSVDLFTAVVAGLRPPDDPLRHLLTDANLFAEEDSEPLYVRLVDLPAALVGRAYADDGTLVFDVDDPFRPVNSGRWRLDVRSGAASCTRTDAEPDLTLDSTTLATLYLGGWRWRSLADARRMVEHRPGAVATADAMFRTERAPWNPQIF